MEPAFFSLVSSNRALSRRCRHLRSGTAVCLSGSPPGPLSLSSFPDSLATADFVYIRQSGVSKPLTPAYSGPYAVLERSSKSFKVDLGGCTDIISVDRLKPHLGTAPLLPASAPRRGRPPSSATSPGGSSLGAG